MDFTIIDFTINMLMSWTGSLYVINNGMILCVVRDIFRTIYLLITICYFVIISYHFKM